MYFIVLPRPKFVVITKRLFYKSRRELLKIDMNNLKNAIQNMESLMSSTTRVLVDGCLQVQNGLKSNRGMKYDEIPMREDIVQNPIVENRNTYQPHVERHGDTNKNTQEVVSYVDSVEVVRRPKRRVVVYDEPSYDLERKVWRDFYRANSL